jgi:hypothetical protein
MTRLDVEEPRTWGPLAAALAAECLARQGPDFVGRLALLLAVHPGLRLACGEGQRLLAAAAKAGRLCRHCSCVGRMALECNPRAREAFCRALARECEALLCGGR